MVPRSASFVGTISAAADFLGPGAIEINRYQAEILDLVRRRFVLGQRINQTPATGQPSRYFEQQAIPTATYTDPRVISATASQPQRIELVVTLKALVAQINYSMFDVEVNQQQGQFAYLEAKDLTDTVDSVLKLHDQGLWTGNDTNLIVPTTNQYFGISGQIANATFVGTGQPPGFTQNVTVSASGSLIDATKTQVAGMVSRTDFEVKPSAMYANPLTLDLFDREAKTLQLYYNETEVIPGVIVKAIPTQAGLLPLVPDAAIPILSVYPSSPQKQYEWFILSEEFIEYHWLKMWASSTATWMLQFLLIDSNAAMPTRANQQTLDAERLSGETSLVDDAIVRPYGNGNRMRSAEMTDPFQLTGSVTDEHKSSSACFPAWTLRQFGGPICLYKIWVGGCQGCFLCSTSGLLHSNVELEFPLIDSEAEIANEAEGLTGHRERLSEETSLVDDATVRSASNNKMQKQAEMTCSFQLTGSVTSKAQSLFDSEIRVGARELVV